MPDPSEPAEPRTRGRDGDPTRGRSAGTPENPLRDPTRGRSAGTPGPARRDPTRPSSAEPPTRSPATPSRAPER